MAMVKLLKNNNAIWSLIAIAINMAINFSIVPYISNRIGLEAYGFVNLANTMITYLDIISIVLNAFACRYIAIEYHIGNHSKANKYFTSTLIANIILSIVLIVVGMAFILNIQSLLKVKSDIVYSVKVLFFTVLIRYIFVLLRNAFDVSTFISNRLDITEKVRSISYIIQAVILLVCVTTMKPEVWYVGLASSVASFFLFISQYILTKKLTPNLHFSIQFFSLDCVFELISSGIWNSINNLGNVLNSGLDLIIANLMISGTGMGMVSVSTTLGSLCYTIVTGVSNSFRPKQLELYSKKQREALIKSFVYSMRITGILSSVIIAGFISCGYDFLELWLGDVEIDVIYKISIIVLLGTVATGVVNPLYYIFTLTNKLKVPCIITVAMGVVNVASMILLIEQTNLGVYAIVITTMVLNCVHFIDTPIYAAYCLGLKFRTFYPVIIKHLWNIVILVIAMNLCNLFYPTPHSWLTLILKIIIYGIFGMAIPVVTTFGKNMLKFWK